ncbi:MAG: Asp-tRNA(Asn)/Glu-tRNA(Gln) amidotransferase subunit GatC [Proteobacteria bacterium]|jgi:aspartyl-tRNA(Asn)/glutamyl-tRNA(Gln) amidotransferase subunit C|nr:Asp-tRNA(Asn)/Glu-tRNA(Gln) amidotransferase subunit GatC [Pseudomonadota bacterium]MDA1351417.1 Asp-tRNA(Asn)/Glu-tRNA(Gln) amidotransferase subunit GatC [Pseudomonadota bacterium]|tara:strand:+ start:3966 stop:4253 length:288 start_codon:yes stop_codon:yes gene_type:complete
MIIERHEIEKLATLSRLSIDEKTITDVTERLSSVLDLVAQLQSADTVSAQGIFRPFQVAQRLRADEVTEGNHRDEFQAIAPATDNGLFIVPKMID